MQDSDGDGFNNHQEFIMGTVPVDADSLFRLNLLSNTNGYSIHWTVTEDREYHLEWTNSLSNAFQTIETFTFPTSSYIDTEHNNIPDNFYRIKVELND